MNVIVLIQQHILLIDFIVLLVMEFDAIFGMDWMTHYWNVCEGCHCPYPATHPID